MVKLLRRRPSRQDLVSRTFELIRDGIVHGRLPPGSRIIEARMVDRLEVSRTTVRGALRRLAQEGYVLNANTNAGRRFHAVVAPLTHDDVVELFTIVGEVEGLAAAAAAARPAPERRALAVELRAINTRYRRGALDRKASDDELFDLDTRFHRTYVEAGGGQRLLGLHDAIKPQAERYVRYYQTVLRAAIQTSVAEHRAIIEPIEAGHPSRAHRAVRANWLNAAKRLAKAIVARGGKGDW
jgi:DNA-binding GntR family transcriptional regulator